MRLFSCKNVLPSSFTALNQTTRVAGSETTASSLASLINNLLRHPKIFDKLKQEIRNTFKSESDIRLEVAMELPYLNACIEENLRIFPPAPIGFLREIQQQGDMVDGHYVPGGVRCSMDYVVQYTDALDRLQFP